MAGTTPPPPPPGDGSTPPPPPVYGNVPRAGFAPDGREYSPWWWRLAGFILDYLPVLVLMVIAGFVARSRTEIVYENLNGYEYRDLVVHSGNWFLATLLWLVAVIYWLVNKGYLEGATGKSLGKRLTGETTVRETTGEPLGAGMGILRAILLYIEVATIGCVIGLICLLWPLWDQKRQTLLSDKATGAVVFRSPS